MRNVFLILEEYDHLKRHPGETVPQFSARFNKVYHAMPADIRPPPGSAHLHYPNAFDPEMTFQLRERNTATLEEMQKIAVDVEANLLNRKAKIREEDKDRTKNELMTSSEMKIDVLTNTIKEMMQKISRKDELVVQRHHVPLISEKEKVTIPKHFAAHPWYHGLDNDSFMYSIHNTVKDKVQNQKMEEDSPDMICMFNGISSMDDSPKLDWYNDDYTTLDFSKKSATYDWEGEDHLQSQQENQSVHGNYDTNDQNAENFQEGENCLPLCFASLLRKHYKQIAHRKEEECSTASVEENKVDTEADPEMQPLSLFESQTSEEIMMPETGDKLYEIF
jgi:hypothetical protein